MIFRYNANKSNLTQISVLNLGGDSGGTVARASLEMIFLLDPNDQQIFGIKGSDTKTTGYLLIVEAIWTHSVG